ncbi:MAG: ATP-binding protein [Sediminibacterium sp.]|nr:ATP-binding protein [Sediminibacterium sp.]
MERLKRNTTIKPLSFILLLSIVLMVVLFFVQSRSDKSIRAMQKGNELAVKTFQINNSLQEIINHVYFIESQTRKQINAAEIKLTPTLNDTIKDLNRYIVEVGKLTEISTQQSFNQLKRLLEKKITLTKDILDSSKSALIAKQKLTGEQNKNLLDSIYIAASDIQIIAETDLQQTIIENSTVSNQVLIISRSLTIFALITILLSATLIIRHLKQNNLLIQALEQAKIKADIAGKIKEQFLANMSHEIRTPLNSIIGFSNLAHKTNLDGVQRDYISFIKSSSENLLYIINDILDFSKLEAGKLQISKAPFNLKDICHFIEMLFQVQLSTKKIHFSYQIEENIPLNLTGDDDRLKQILTNLVSNAIKFTGTGGNISLRLNLIKQEDETVFIQFAIKDTGIGIPEDKLKTIFERFEQADSATTRKYGGTGLGLSIVKQLVTLQNGTVDVHSTINAGSEFIVTIPYSINRMANSENNDKKDTPIVKQFNTAANILIAEDNKMNQMLLKFLFQNWGIKITLAADGKEAIDYLQKNEYDLILLDIQMPNVDGYGVAQWIRNTQKSNVPIIAMTAHTMPTEIEKSKEAGMNDYLSKPLIEERVIELFNLYIPQLPNNTIVKKMNTTYVDLNNIIKLVGDEPAIIKELLGHFTKHYPEEVAQLEATYNSKDMEQLYTIAHNLKTTVTSLKTNSELVMPLIEIEKYKNIDADWNKIGEFVALLSKSVEPVLTEIKALEQELAVK